jgi:3-deoxy-7-phosphoheptulonate synthase
LKQLDVAADIARQISVGNHQIVGVMVESHLQAGSQKFLAGQQDPAKLEYGKSITDPCLGWEDSIQLLHTLSEAVKKRRKRV